MAQAQLTFTENSLDFLKSYGLHQVIWSPVSASITCCTDDKFSLLVRRARKRIRVSLRKDNQSMSLPYSFLESFCDLK